VRRGLLACLLGSALSIGGALAIPAHAAHWDPNTQTWVIDCSSAPAYNPKTPPSVSGWDVFAGPADGAGTWIGIRAQDPYAVAHYDTNAKSASVGVWQPWYGNDVAPPVLFGPMFVDAGVSVNGGAANPANIVTACNKSVLPTAKP
jgi:hypothetical protein